MFVPLCGFGADRERNGIRPDSDFHPRQRNWSESTCGGMAVRADVERRRLEPSLTRRTQNRSAPRPEATLGEGIAIVRRRPIPRSAYRWSPSPKAPSLRYEIILSGAAIRFPDGREVCQDNAAGYREYKKRVEIMWRRQERKCCLCNRRLALANATFEHQRRRGMGSAWRDDRIEKDGEDWNGAAHWVCNGEKG